MATSKPKWTVRQLPAQTVAVLTSAVEDITKPHVSFPHGSYLILKKDNVIQAYFIKESSETPNEVTIIAQLVGYNLPVDENPKAEKKITIPRGGKFPVYGLVLESHKFSEIKRKPEYTEIYSRENWIAILDQIETMLFTDAANVMVNRNYTYSLKSTTIFSELKKKGFLPENATQAVFLKGLRTTIKNFAFKRFVYANGYVRLNTIDGPIVELLNSTALGIPRQLTPNSAEPRVVDMEGLIRGLDLVLRSLGFEPRYAS